MLRALRRFSRVRQRPMQQLCADSAAYKSGVALRLGLLSLPLTGHLNPMLALARALQERGHQVLFFNLPDIRSVSLAAGIPFIPFGGEEAPVGYVPNLLKPLATLSGLPIIEDWFQRLLPDLLGILFQHLPDALTHNPVDGLIIDAAYRSAPLVAMQRHIPFLQIWLPMHYDLSGSTPIPTFSWPPEKTPEALARNKEALQQLAQLAARTSAMGAAYAEQVGLEIDLRVPAALASPLGILTQSPQEFDFPNSSLPTQLRYVGPLQHDATRASIAFPWDKLDGRPLVYASLGTLVNGSENVRNLLLQAMSMLPELQFVLTLGGSDPSATSGKRPSNVMVVEEAPQLEVLKRASLCITHAGLNTVLECLRLGVPMVAVPIGFDQPGVAARIAYHQVGEKIELDELTADRLIRTIRQVLHDGKYQSNAAHFKAVLAENYALDKAARLVEDLFAQK